MSLLINRSNKWGFVHIPKTGGTSITNILSNVPGTEKLVVHDSIRVFTETQNYFIFCFVRNPFTRLASTYYHECRKLNKEISFGNFIKSINENYILYLPQSYYINSGKGETNQISFIGRYETYKKDVNYILKKIGYQHPIPHLNRNPLYDKHPNLNQEKYYKYIYSEEWMKDWVRERYKNDFRIFNYDMDI